MTSHDVHIEGFRSPVEFVKRWSAIYNYRNEIKYIDHINDAFRDKKHFQQLFLWKNGTNEKIAEKKQKVVDEYWDKRKVLQSLKEGFEWKLYEQTFEPSKKATIWSIFLLHLIDPDRFPIYDQHVYRFYHFHLSGEIKEISSNATTKYSSYKDHYIEWFNSTAHTNQLDKRNMDKAFFAFGKMLKRLPNISLVHPQKVAR